MLGVYLVGAAACCNIHRDIDHIDCAALYTTSNHDDLRTGLDFVGVVYSSAGHVTEGGNSPRGVDSDHHDIGPLSNSCRSSHHVFGSHHVDSYIVLDNGLCWDGVGRAVGGVSSARVVPLAVRLEEAVTLAVWAVPLAVMVVEAVTLAVWVVPLAVRVVEAVTLAVWVVPLAVRVVEAVTPAVWVVPLAVRVVEAVTPAVWAVPLAVRVVEAVTLEARFEQKQRSA